MRQLDSSNIAVLAVIGLVLLGVSILAAGVAIDLADPGPNSDHLASALQAIGPILAVLGLVLQANLNGHKADQATLVGQQNADALVTHGQALDAMQSSLLGTELHAHRVANEAAHAQSAAEHSRIQAAVDGIQPGTIVVKDAGT